MLILLLLLPLLLWVSKGMHCKQFNTASIRERTLDGDCIVCRSNCDFEFVLRSTYTYIHTVHLVCVCLYGANLSMRELFYIEFFRISNLLKEEEEKKTITATTTTTTTTTMCAQTTMVIQIHTCDQRE